MPTFEDYRSWDDEQSWELLEGRPYLMSSPSSLHQMLSMSLILALGPHVQGQGCRLLHAPMDLKLSEMDVVQPDLMVVCDPSQIRAGHIEGPPRLVVEILSATTQRHDRVRKLNLYARTGVAEYWLGTPYPFMVEVLHNRQGVFSAVGAYTEGDTLHSSEFPNLRLELASLYASLPPQPPLDEVREGTPAYLSGR
ncbi:hypothetical protein ABS71_14190 [bacterium SCN 62-11]|nr:MAG: hypothetical protein ABS71_14190 [bacterium SCN 62-11]